jgi:hypothetical protein
MCDIDHNGSLIPLRIITSNKKKLTFFCSLLRPQNPVN